MVDAAMRQGGKEDSFLLIDPVLFLIQILKGTAAMMGAEMPNGTNFSG